MTENQEVIIDSDMSFADAVEGTIAPEQILDTLSLIDVLYYSFDGKRHSGQMLVNSKLEDDICEIFALVEKLRFPVAKAVPIVVYQWDDHRSMADNNSSAFNFRVIEGTTKMSLHSFGRAVDINPALNPVIYPNGVVAPQGAKYIPSRTGALTAQNPIVQEFLKRGWHWGGNFDQPKDYHHFEKP